MKIFSFLILLFSLQQTDLSLIENKLTNGSQRQWSKIDEDYIMGNSNCLAGGLIYTFSKTANKILTIKKCVDGRWITTTYSWQLTSVEQEPVLIIYNELKSKLIYHIRFIEKKGSQQLRLTDHGRSKAEPTREIYFE